MRRALFRQEALTFTGRPSWGTSSWSVRCRSRCSPASLSASPSPWWASPSGGEYTRKAHVTGLPGAEQGVDQSVRPASWDPHRKARDGRTVRQTGRQPVRGVLRTEFPRDPGGASHRHGPAPAAPRQPARRARQARAHRSHPVRHRCRTACGAWKRNSCTSRPNSSSRSSASRARQTWRSATVSSWPKTSRRRCRPSKSTKNCLTSKSKLHNLQRSRLALEGDIQALKRELAASDLKAKNQQRRYRTEYLSVRPGADRVRIAAPGGDCRPE